jgi:triphosphoribosyl-dephospho-CoA synthase
MEAGERSRLFQDVSSRRLGVVEAAGLAAFACRAELEAAKPGNVTLRRGLPGLRPADFLRSAEALRAAFARRRPRTVGILVLDAIRRTRRRVHTNTNLGLSLILAPLALASTRSPFEQDRGAGRSRRPAAEGRGGSSSAAGGSLGSLRRRVERVLRSMTTRDARQVYEAIRLARPGGMGKVVQEDISGRPRRSLRACMALATRRDAIASEYARGYPLTFGVGAPALERWLGAGLPLGEAVVMTYLTLLARRPDSLVARRRGVAVARRVSRRAARVLALGGVLTRRGRRALASFDAWLRRSGLNPGTTADLTAAAIFAHFAALSAAGARRRRAAPAARRPAPRRRARSEAAPPPL